MLPHHSSHSLQLTLNFGPTPAAGSSKINVDVSFVNVRRAVSAAVVIKDSLGSMLYGQTPAAKAAEALAIRNGILLGSATGSGPVIIETDARSGISCQLQFQL